MLAIKDNKVYTITEEEKENYASRGFDIQDDNGNIVMYGKGRTVAFEKYKALEEENAKLKEDNKKLKAEVKSLKSDKGEK